ncbi:MAG: hydroxymethylglutaryl-CoA lyase [Deltaproteobacteria bacterium]|nr:hydroxymethylglutaryl-CoA lyase [Deltaproteobacteria bacterium]
MSGTYGNLPEAVRIVEVAPRDGWQNLGEFIPTATKVELVSELAACGFAEIEVSSFVNPRAIPQLADAAQVLAGLETPAELIRSVLVPNRRGLVAALESPVDKLVFFISASDTHNHKNLGCSQADTLVEIEAMQALVPEDRARRVSVSNVFGCPYEGEIAYDAVSRLVAALVQTGLSEITLCDTLGVAVPDQVYLFCASLQEQFPEVDFGLHLHDSCGRALACVMAGLQAGITRYDSAAGGLGGCPFAPGAAGNLATEDLVSCLERMGIATGVDPEKLLAAARRQAGIVRAGNSHMLAFTAGCRQ